MKLFNNEVLASKISHKQLFHTKCPAQIHFMFFPPSVCMYNAFCSGLHARFQLYLGWRIHLLNILPVDPLCNRLHFCRPARFQAPPPSWKAYIHEESLWKVSYRKTIHTTRCETPDFLFLNIEVMNMFWHLDEGVGAGIFRVLYHPDPTVGRNDNLAVCCVPWWIFFLNIHKLYLDDAISLCCSNVVSW